MDRDAHVVFKEFAEIIFGKADFITDGIYIEIILIIVFNIFKTLVYNSFLDRSDGLGFYNAVGDIVKLKENIMYDKAGFHVSIQLFIKIQVHGFDKIVQYLVQRTAGQDAGTVADQIIIELGMCSPYDYVKKLPVFSCPVKDKGGVAGRYDDVVLVDELGSLVLGKTDHTGDRIEQQDI